MSALNEERGVTSFAISADSFMLSSPGSVESDLAASKDAEKDHLQELMEGYQQADADATTELVHRISPMLLRFLSGPLQTRSQADDMLQECWLRVHRARASYRPGSPVLPWVFAIARHTRIDAYRRRSRIERREFASDNLEATATASIPAPDAEDGDIWRLVAQLPQSQQDVVRMLKITGMSLEEVAGATGTTVGSVKQKAHRAYRKLRELLTELEKS
jgi:RNA polymerase sigma-70 factor (ECF subfamily)